MNSAAKAIVAVWMLLMLSTVASTWGFSQPMFTPTVSTVAVMLIAAIKVVFVMAYFMDMRRAPRSWQFAGTIWVVVTASVVMGFYLL